MEGGVRSMLTYFPHLQQFVAVALIAFLAVMVANVADCVDAMMTARAAGKPIESAKLRHALWKLCKEWVLLIVVFLIDLLMAFCWTTLPFITVVCAIALFAAFHGRARKAPQGQDYKVTLAAKRPRGVSR